MHRIGGRVHKVAQGCLPSSTRQLLSCSLSALRPHSIAFHLLFSLSLSEQFASDSVLIRNHHDRQIKSKERTHKKRGTSRPHLFFFFSANRVLGFSQVPSSSPLEPPA